MEQNSSTLETVRMLSSRMVMLKPTNYSPRKRKIIVSFVPTEILPKSTEELNQSWRLFILVKSLHSNGHGSCGRVGVGGAGDIWGGRREVVPATDLCRFLFFRFLWLLWWLPEEEEAAFWGFTPCTDPSRSSGSSGVGSFSWLWKSGEVSLSVPLPGSPWGKKHKSPEAPSVLGQSVRQSGRIFLSTNI